MTSQIFEKFKTKWKIRDNKHLVIILVVFSLTGFSTLFLEELIVEAINLPSPQGWWLRILVFIFLTLPLYNLILLTWALVFGQFRFFTGFVKQFFGSLLKLFTGKRAKKGN